MATAVLDLDLKKLPQKIEGLSAYHHAFILLRYQGTPIGKLTVPVFDGTIDIHEFSEQIISASESILVEYWMNEQIGIEKPDIKKKLPIATIAICTRNRTSDLNRCLDALMKLPDDGQEYLVIDNCPSDDQTQALVAGYPNVRYVREPKRGLNTARNRALTEAKHEIVLFTDDDAMPDPNWLRSILCNFDHPLVMCVTGMTMPMELETDAQEAFEKYSPFGKGFKKKIFKGDAITNLSAGHIGAGANMALRKSVVHAVGYFDEALDAGTITKSGGDHEFFIRILLRGYDIVYEPGALSWHKHRRTWKETRDAIRGYGTGVYAYWTRLFFVEGEPGVIKLAFGWFIHDQLPDLIVSFFRRPYSKPLSLLIAEMQGCLLGPWRYFLSRVRTRKRARKYG